ncbi:MAG: hypothetical protein ACO3CR_07710 [Solirubrobacterales bacterium]
MNTSTIEARRMPAKRLGVFALGIAVACAGMFGLAASKAEASPTNEPVQMQLNDGLLNLGAAFVGKEVLPAPSRLPGSTSDLPNWWDITDSIVATGADPANNNVCSNPVAAGGVNPNAQYPCGGNPGFGLIQATGGAGSVWNPTAGSITLARVVPGGTFNSEPVNLDVRFPIMQVPSPTTGGPVPIPLAASGIVTGTYNPTTGAVELTPAGGTSFEARVLVGLGITAANGGPQPYTYCKVPLPGLTLSTGTGTGSKAFAGTPFVGGLAGTGALQGTYTVADNSTSVLQTLAGTNATAGNAALTQCASAVDLVIKGDGGLWFGNRVDPPACAESQIGTYPDCTDPKADITKIAVTGKKSVKKGKKVKLTVKVTNSGTADESVKLRLWSSNGGVASVTGQTTVSAPAGGTGTKTVTVTAKKKKGSTTIHATNGAKTGKLSVKVK